VPRHVQPAQLGSKSADVFEGIYEVGTVSGAADHLALSQSATSHALSRLRDACKDDLFIRGGRGLSPTPVAQEMYPAIKQALDALRATLAEASGFDPGASQRHFRIVSRILWGRFTRSSCEPSWRLPLPVSYCRLTLCLGH
jgi:DNA-binding transcriptional LysR family regulator